MAGEIDEHKIVKYKNKIIKTAAKLKRKNEKLAKAKVRVEDSKKTIRSYLITQIHVIRSMVLYTFAYILLMFIFFILFIPFLYLGVYKLTVNRRDKRISEQIERNEKDISILLSAYGMV